MHVKLVYYCLTLMCWFQSRFISLSSDSINSFEFIAVTILHVKMETGYIISLIIFLLFLPFINKVYNYYRNRYILSAIPSPPGHFFLGNLPDVLTANKKNIFTNLRRYARDHGPIYRFTTFYITTINLLSPDDIEVVLNSSKHTGKSLIYQFLKVWLGEGLLTSSGAKWQTRRKILTPAFHFNILQQFLKVFNEETLRLVNKLENETFLELNIVPYVTEMALQSISEAAMGLTNIKEEEKITYKKAIYDIGEILLNKLTRPWHRVQFLHKFTKLYEREQNTLKILHEFTENVIREREKQIEKENVLEIYSGRKKMAMLDLLITAKLTEGNIDYNGIREEVDTFMFEGHDTTAMALSFLLLSLAWHKDVQEKVVEEIDSIIGLSSSQPPTYNDLQNLKYTERVIKETLRLYPSVPFISRLASEDFTSPSGYKIPKGTVLHVHIFDLHRNPKLFPEPEKFDPDRFLPEETEKRHPFAYIPFSAGPRNCIGQRFAVLELKSVICGVLRRFSLESVDDPGVIKFSPDLVLRPEGGIKVKFCTR